MPPILLDGLLYHDNDPVIEERYTDTADFTEQVFGLCHLLYWSGTTHATWVEDNAGRAGAYVAFGRSLGYMDGGWTDVHGAGSQRSDPKEGNPNDYPTGRGPQGDAIRREALIESDAPAR